MQSQPIKINFYDNKPVIVLVDTPVTEDEVAAFEADGTAEATAALLLGHEQPKRSVSDPALPLRMLARDRERSRPRPKLDGIPHSHSMQLLQEPYAKFPQLQPIEPPAPSPRGEARTARERSQASGRAARSGHSLQAMIAEQLESTLGPTSRGLSAAARRRAGGRRAARSGR